MTGVEVRFTAGDRGRRKARRGEPLAFLARLVAAAPRDDCVEWPYSRNSGGYGNLEVAGRGVLASRQVLILLTGEDPPGQVARHGPCHNRACVNPHHLSWGTEVQNARDRHRDGTRNAGASHHRARLTEADVHEIRRRYAEGTTQVALAAGFGVSAGHISGIVSRRFWREVA